MLAGPYCAYQLALLGADVIKVEQPAGGDLARQLGASPELNKAGMGASFLAQNAGKRSVVLDLKKEADRARFLDLVATSDALVENFRPGVMQRLGLGYERLKEVRPGLVYCAISGFGQTGPMRDNPAYDQIIQGLSGDHEHHRHAGDRAAAGRLSGLRHAGRAGRRLRHRFGAAAPEDHRRRRVPRRLDARMHTLRRLAGRSPTT